MTKQKEYILGIWTWKRLAILEAITLFAIFLVELNII